MKFTEQQIIDELIQTITSATRSIDSIPIEWLTGRESDRISQMQSDLLSLIRKLQTSDANKYIDMN